MKKKKNSCTAASKKKKLQSYFIIPATIPDYLQASEPLWLAY